MSGVLKLLTKRAPHRRRKLQPLQDRRCIRLRQTAFPGTVFRAVQSSNCRESATDMAKKPLSLQRLPLRWHLTCQSPDPRQIIDIRRQPWLAVHTARQGPHQQIDDALIPM